MITWREEGERPHHIAMLGEIEAGRIFKSDFDDGFMAYLDLKSGGPIQRYWASGLLPTLSAAKAALAEAVGGWVKRAGLVKDEGWRPMADAKKDGVPILALFRSNLVAWLARPDLDPWEGVQACIRHPGLLPADRFDIGWQMAAPVGCGGFPDDWFVGWRPLPTPPARS